MPTTSPAASAEPTAGPTPTPGPTVTAAPTPAPSATATPAPTSTPPPTAPPSPTTSPIPSAPPTPSPGPTATPGPTASPTGGPTPAPSPSPTPPATATPDISLTIAAARLLADGDGATIIGTLTTDLGALEAGRSGFVQDATAGIAVYLDAALVSPLPAGSVVRLEGTLDERYGARTLRVSATAITVLGFAALPLPAAVLSGEVGERLEGLRVTVTGTTSGSPTTYADGIGVLVDDGSGAVSGDHRARRAGRRLTAIGHVPAGSRTRRSARQHGERHVRLSNPRHGTGRSRAPAGAHPHAGRDTQPRPDGLPDSGPAFPWTDRLPHAVAVARPVPGDQ